ncbi:uncharacterized protein LOC129594460 [Paramacrobiotus metropolitanus]|uniref:uncharacterized protein LOC129594460 n=1 Tax=Paramacrobiotus metropolitanus TaxID=2943436 RepID=UPI002445B176|nr:uncharacterized protein LOC129594460 [Paramacrobiotus metropolitanus]
MRNIVFRILGIVTVLTGCRALNFITVIIGENRLSGYYAAMPYYDAAFDIAAQRYPAIFGNLTRIPVYKPGNTDCKISGDEMPELLGRVYKALQEMEGLTILLSHGCSPEMIILGDFAREVKVPLLASLSTDVIFTDRRRYSTVVGFGGTSQGNQVPAIRAFLRHYLWTTVTLFCDAISNYTTLSGFIGANCRGLQAVLTAANGYELYVENYDSSKDPDYTPRLLRAKSQSRIYIIFTRADQMRKLMVTAHALNMTRSEFVYIHPMCNQGVGYLPLDVNVGDDDDTIIRQAYKYVIKVTFTPIDYESAADFLHAVAVKADSSYNFTYGYDELHNEIAMAIPEMILSVGKALNESSIPLSALSYNDFLNLFVNCTFDNGVLRQVVMGPLGMRLVDSVFYKLNPVSQEFQRISP